MSGGELVVSAASVLSVAVREVWLAAIVGAVVALLSWGVGGRRVALRQALWSLVLLRLVLPPGLAHPFSLASLLPVFGEAVEWTGDGVSGTPTSIPTGSGAPARPASAPWLPAGVLAVWAAGALLLLGRDARRARRCRDVVRSAEPIVAGRALAEAERVRRGLGIRRSVRLVATPLRVTPFNMGVLRPVIVVPRILLEPNQRPALRAALAHELAHVARWDTLRLWLQQLVARAYFFHPFVWLAVRQLHAGRETLADSLVVSSGVVRPRAYARGLLRALELDLSGAAALGLGTNSRRFVMRVRSIVGSDPTSRRSAWGALLAATVVGLLVLPLGPRITDAGAILAASEPVAGSKSLSNPLPGARITAPYGASQRHPFTGKPYFHSGVDLAASKKAPVKSAGAGVVEIATTNYTPNKNAGTVVVVDHGKGLKTFYAHLGELSIKEGQRVSAGQQLAVVGMSGLTTGPHIHFEVWHDGEHVDPGIDVDGIPLRPQASAADADEGAYDQPARPLSTPNPQYPKQAFDAKLEGTVLVDIEIDATGRVAGAQVIESVPGLDEAALEAVQKWTFHPAMKDGRPVASTAHAPVTFKIF